MNQRIHLAACLLFSLAAPALATFPMVPIDCDLFDTESAQFLDHNFGFGTEMSLSSGGSTIFETGFEGFVATPEQVLQIPDFASGAELPVGGHTLEDLLGGPITPPPFVQEAAIWQSIEGEGGFAEGFSRVTLKQRKLFELAQDFDGQADVFGQGKGYAPFYAASNSDQPIDVRLTIDLFSYFDVDAAAVSESIGGALLNVNDPENPVFMDGVFGFYFADDDEVIPGFARGAEGLQDVTQNFFTGPESTDPGARQIASFFYTIDAQLNPGENYGLGLFGDGGAGLDGPGSAELASVNTASVSIEVLTPGASLMLPGGLIPEPTSGALALLACCGLARRGAAPRR